MGTNWYVACNKCETQTAVGKRSPAGFSFWSNEKEEMSYLRKMLEVCTWEHPDALCFINEHDERHEKFRFLDPESEAERESLS